MFSLLQDHDLHFTFSSREFIRTFLLSAKADAFVLIDSADALRVGKEIIELGQAIIESNLFPKLGCRKDMTFLDLSMLKITSLEPVQHWQTTNWNEIFCCGLAMGPDVVDNLGQRCVQAFWSMER
jgi:hypothetical protein